MTILFWYIHISLNGMYNHHSHLIFRLHNLWYHGFHGICLFWFVYVCDFVTRHWLPDWCMRNSFSTCMSPRKMVKNVNHLLSLLAKVVRTLFDKCFFPCLPLSFFIRFYWILVSRSSHIMYMGVSKNRGTMGYPKMDGENDGTPYEKSMDLGVYIPFFWFNTHIF